MVDKFWFEAANVSCFKNGYEVIRNLNLQLKYSENVLLIGPNGSGKSSLIELINRNVYPVIRKGMVLKIFNQELINLWELRRRISTVNNDIKDRISPKLKVFELILSGLYGKYCQISKQSKSEIYIVNTLIKKINIVHLFQKEFSDLSDGEKQIALFARALVNNPEFLILDEPTANLDYKSKLLVIDQIDELARLGTKIICITHDISIITKIYDRIIMLKDREIIADGNQKEVINSSNFKKLFDINLRVEGNQGNWIIKRSSK